MNVLKWREKLSFITIYFYLRSLINPILKEANEDLLSFSDV